MISKSLLAKRDHVWSKDPAIDKEHPDYKWDDYLKDGDLRHLPRKEGAEFTVFTLGPVTRTQMTRIYNFENLERMNAMVAYGLRGVSNYLIDGQAVVLDFTSGTGSADRRVKDSSLDIIFDAALFSELAERILSLSQIDPL